MATLKLKQALIIDGKVVEGSEHTPTTITLANGGYHSAQDIVVADAFGTATLWTTLGGGLTTYTHGFIISNKDGKVELRTDNGTPEFVLLEVKAGVLTFLPGIVGGDTTESLDGAILVDGTDFDDVDRIEFQRDAAESSGDALVSLHLFN